MLASVAQTGGHLSSNLGTVELTIALHYVFDTPNDRLVWDVGHQTYPHKILTGRREPMAQPAASGRPFRLSAAATKVSTTPSARATPALRSVPLWAWRWPPHDGRHARAVAVIGDGAMTAGMAFEALNNAGDTGRQPAGGPQRQRHVDLPQVGAFEQLSGKAAVEPLYAAAPRRREGAVVAPPMRELAKRAEEHVKGMVRPARCSRSSASTTSARSTATIWTRW